MGAGKSGGPRAVSAMNLPVIIRTSARQEFDDAADWYEQRRSAAAALGRVSLLPCNKFSMMPQQIPSGPPLPWEMSAKASCKDFLIVFTTGRKLGRSLS